MSRVSGIDVAKASVDVVVLVDAQAAEHAQFSNDTAGFQRLKAWLDKRAGHDLQAGPEATGNFSEDLAAFLYAQG